MKYEFPLEPVLCHRTNIEQGQAQEMAKLRVKFIEAERVLEELLGSEREAAAGLARDEKNGVDFREISIYRNFLESVQPKIVNQKKAINELENVLEKKRQDLVHASKEKKVVEKLKEKGKLRFFTDMEKRIQKESDELTSMKHSNKGNKIVK